MLENAAPLSTSDGAWGGGSLDEEELERAALAFRPSWELGLDAARRGGGDSLAPPSPVAPSESFAPGSASNLDVVAAAAQSSPSRQSLAPPAASIRPVPVAKTERAEAAPRRESRPAMRDIKSSLPDQVPAKKSSTGLFVGAGIGIAAVVGALVFAFGGSSSTPTNSEPAAQTAPATNPESASSPTPAANPEPAPAPAPAVAAPEPAPSPPPMAAAPTPEPVPAPPPAPVVAAPEPPPAPPPAPAVAAPAPPPPRPVVAAPAPPPPRPVVAARVAPAPRPAAAPAAPRAPRASRSSGASPRGAGFVTDNPY